MAVVVDANLLVALVSGDPRGDQVLKEFLDWVDLGIDLHAPALAHFEVANVLTCLIVAGAFPADRVEESWANLSILPITYHPFDRAPRIVEIALTLGRRNAYDAAYLALAEKLGADLWTLGGPLYRNAAGHGFAARLLA